MAENNLDKILAMTGANEVQTTTPVKYEPIEFEVGRTYDFVDANGKHRGECIAVVERGIINKEVYEVHFLMPVRIADKLENKPVCYLRRAIDYFYFGGIEIIENLNMTAEIKIPNGYSKVKVGYACGFKGEELYCLVSNCDGIKPNLVWERWKIDGRLHQIKRGEIFIRKLIE